MASDVLVVLVDCHSVAWGHRAEDAAREDTPGNDAAGTGAAQSSSLTFAQFVDQLIVFLNAFLILNKANQLCVIGMNAREAAFVWPPHMANRTSSGAVEAATPAEATARRTAKATGSAASAAAGAAAGNGVVAAKAASHDAEAIGVDEELLRLLHDFAGREYAGNAAAGPTVEETGSKMAGALSLGLCYLNRVHTQSSVGSVPGRIRSRLLIFSLCPDESRSYVSMMNGIFSTQKQSIPVDACVLAEKDSLFLQQASHLTNGVYGRVPMQNQHALLQYLMFMYLSDPTSRQHLILPTQRQVDFRATCFCHQQVVSMAVICPVCLAIFCASKPMCQVCKTRFAVATTIAPPRPATPNLQQASAVQ